MSKAVLERTLNIRKKTQSFINSNMLQGARFEADFSNETDVILYDE